MNKYHGKKLIEKWIVENTFNIYEYVNSNNSNILENIIYPSLREVLKGRRQRIKIERITSLKTWVRIEYNGRDTFKFHAGQHKILYI